MWDYCNDLFKLLLNLPKNWCSTGLIDGYADEKAFLEKQLQEKIDVIDHLEQELLCTGNKLQELEAEQQQIQEEKELLARQKDAMRADAGPVEQRMYFPQSFYKIFLFLSKIMSDPGEIVCLVFYPFLIFNKNMKWQNVTFSHLVPNVSEITLQDGWTKKKCWAIVDVLEVKKSLIPMEICYLYYCWRWISPSWHLCIKILV